MPLQDYARLKVFFNGAEVKQLTGVNKTTNSGNQRVDVLHEGLAGFTSGAGDVTIEVTFPVPLGGPEFDYEGVCARKEYCTLQLFEGRKAYAGTGKIDNVKVGQDTGKSTEGTFSWTGELKAPE